MNEGAKKLRDCGLTLVELKGCLVVLGIEVTEMTLSNWRAGKTRPNDEQRKAMEGEPLQIPSAAWDSEAPKLPAVPSGRRAARMPPKGAKARDPVPTSRPDGTLSAPELARDYLDRVAGWREASESPECTDAQRRQYASMERQAIQLYARLTGQSEAPESQLVKSPQWARLKADLLAALEPHPKALKAVRTALERHGDAS